MHRRLLKALGGGVEFVPLLMIKTCLYSITKILYLKIDTLRDIDMSSQKPRLNLTLDDELNDLITDLAKLMGIPKTRVITDVLKDVLPVLTEMRDALELAKEKKNVLPHLARIAANANIKTGIINSEMVTLLNQYDLLGDNSND